MNLSGLFKFLTGFVLAIALLFFSGVSAARYFISRLTASPPKPIFPNDSPTTSTENAASLGGNSPSPSSPGGSPSGSLSPKPNPIFASPSPSPSEPGSYQARVDISIGLVLREEPSRSAAQIGGLEYNDQITVLETSSDGEWLRVKLPESDIEGWVKAGNVRQVN